MSLTPVDLVKKDFSRKMRGCDANEVKDFLKEVAEEFDKLLCERTKLAHSLESLEDELKRYKDIEATLNNALVLAQKTADEVKASALREADVTVREIRETTNRELESARREIEELRQAKDRFTVEFRSLLRSYLAVCEGGDIGRRTEQPSD